MRTFNRAAERARAERRLPFCHDTSHGRCLSERIECWRGKQSELVHTTHCITSILPSGTGFGTCFGPRKHLARRLRLENAVGVLNRPGSPDTGACFTQRSVPKTSECDIKTQTFARDIGKAVAVFVNTAPRLTNDPNLDAVLERSGQACGLCFWLARCGFGLRGLVGHGTWCGLRWLWLRWLQLLGCWHRSWLLLLWWRRLI